MIFLDELKPNYLYKKPFIIPINEKDKRKGSAIFLMSPNFNTSIRMMNLPYVINRNYFHSYYVERDIAFVLNQTGTVTESVDTFNEALSAEERKNLKDSDFGLPAKKKYPMPDSKHVLSAIRFFNYVDREDEKLLANNIKKKAKEYNMKDIRVGGKNRLRSYLDSSNTEFVIDESADDLIHPTFGYLSENNYIINENYMRYKVEGTDVISFFNEDSKSYNSVLRRYLYSNRIKNTKEQIEIYNRVKESSPNITKTFTNKDMYKGLNLFIDLFPYNFYFSQNNTYKLDRAVDLYLAFMERMINNITLNEYNKKTLFIPLFGWDYPRDTYIWDYKTSINPISVIYRLIKTNPTKLKDTFGGIDVVFVGLKGYFKLDFNTIDTKIGPRFLMMSDKLSSNQDIEEEDLTNAKDSSKAIVADIVDKIETSQRITINNLTGKSTTTKEEIKDKIDNSLTSSSDKVADKKKEELVDAIKNIADKSSSVDDAIDAMEDDERIKKILIDLSNQESNNVKISAARATRMTELQNEFLEKQVKNVSVRDLLDPANTVVKELPTTNIGKKIDTINEEWNDMKFINFEKTYNLDKDIVSILNSFSSKNNPIGIRNIDVQDTSTSEDDIETYTIECEDINGKRFTLVFDIPKFKNNRFMRLRGNEKVLSGQLVLLPIIKTDLDRVQIVTNYNKIIIDRFGSTVGKSYPTADRFIKTLTKNKIPGIKVSTGDNRKVCAKYELPIDYVDIASAFNTVESSDHILYFNQDEFRKKYTSKIDDSKGIPIAFQKSSGNIMYYNENAGLTCSDVIMTLLSSNNDFTNLFNKTNTATRYAYSKASILHNKIPVIVILGYNIGLLQTLNRANVKFNIMEKLDRIKGVQDYIKFKDGYLVYDLNYESSLLMNGLKECNTDDYSLDEIDSKAMWLDFLDIFANRFIADGLDNFYDLLVDPITMEICHRYNLPDNYVDMLIYANNLLADNKYNKHTDLSGNRYRTNEVIAGYVYKVLAASYQEYATQLRRGRKDTKMTIKKSAVIDEVMQDSTMSDLSILNPLLEAEAANTASFKGLTGMNSDRAYSLDKRTYDESMINLLALSTGFAANVGITRQTTMDMNVEGERGYLKTNDTSDDMSITKTFSITEAMTPFGTTHDDPIRSAMNFIQTSKHSMRVKKSMPLLITNGADEAIPYMTSDIFSYKAKSKGKIVEKTDEYVVISYDDGTNDFIDLREKTHKNSDGGFFITIKLDSDYKVGQTVRENDIIAYDKQSFSSNVSPNNNLAYNIGTLAKLAIMNTDEGYEDSAIVSEWVSDALASDIVVKVPVVIPKNSNVYNIVKKGQAISEGESLITIQNAFKEDDMNILLKNLADDEGIVSDDIGRKHIKAKTSGIVEDILIFRTVERDELSDSLKKIIDENDKNIRAIKNVMDKYNIKSNELQADYKLDPIGKLKGAMDSVMIEFYIKYEDKFSIGDKLTYSSALKGVCKDVFPEGKEPYSDFRKDEKIHSLLAIASINARMVTSIKTTAGINKVLIELDRSVKDIMGIPYKYLDQM